MRRTIFVSGGTGYMGVELIRRLVARGHSVTALARAQSAGKLPAGCAVVPGNALDEASFSHAVPPGSTYVHLVGVAHPAPWKAAQFRSIDQTALEASVIAAVAAKASHFVFVSVAHPAPAMKTYIAVRTHCEEILARSGLNATILRPWYVLGPGHRWPYALIPFYKLAERIPSLRAGALRLGLVTHAQMVSALEWAVENPVAGRRVLEVPEIRVKTASWRPSARPQWPRAASEAPSTAAESARREA